MATTTQKRVYSVLAEFATSGELLKAAEKVRDAGYRKFDCHSPFPIHGMDAAMGLPRSKVGYIAGISGLCGGLFGMWMQWWTSSVDYPVVISGKPYFSFQAFIIVTFGLTILGAALGAVVGMLFLNRLPQWFHGNFYSENFKRFSDDAFIISIESDDPNFEPERVRKFFETIGGRNIEVVAGE
ncbi:MAG: DUF3341 domain-containing protein [Candidatus Zixiibacteriota bacterium]